MLGDQGGKSDTSDAPKKVGVSMEYHGSTVGVSLKYHGSTIGVLLEYHGSIVGVPLKYHWSIIGVGVALFPLVGVSLE